MTAKRAEGKSDWLSLGEASKLLGVHPATLRQWADQGKIPVFRTPGGHRRFAVADVRALLETETKSAARQDLQILVQSALGRTRLEVSGGRLKDEPWYERYDEAARKQHRQLGQRLLGLVMHYLNEDHNQAATLQEGLKLGQEYGRLAFDRGLSLTEAVRAFLLFRDFLIESVVQMAGTATQPGISDVTDTHRRVNAFANEVLLAMVQTYETGLSGGNALTE
jgi:excisionase family DNA binding protein